MILTIFLLTPASSARVCKGLLDQGFTVSNGFRNNAFTKRSDAESLSTAFRAHVTHSELDLEKSATSIRDMLKLLEVPHFGFTLVKGNVSLCTYTGFIPLPLTEA